MTIPLEIREVLVCDDIRREDNGKAILIGVYTGDMVFSNFPVNVRLSFWLQGRARKGAGAGQAQFKIDVTQQDIEQAPTLVDAIFDAPPSEIIGGVLVFASVPITAKQPGRLVLSIKDDDDGKWVELMNKKIILANPTATTSEPSTPH